ncbi:putative disease resistance protein At3g14460 [Durio zibethinus]|uniref:Disease resistance protein At3g14460 n=1 Tax=Durio zibethinus TaxID=66656 RepID=A0A6P6AHG1_DURZI|nr:putative disease resistance protein At3g14460 [Durio zibethinus]
MVWEIAVAAAVGKALLSSSFSMLFKEMASGKFLDFFRTKKLSLDLLQKLKLKLLAVNSVLDDAEEQQHVMNLPVKEWLDELKDALYEAEDLFDEIAAEALKYDMEAGYQTQKEQVDAFNAALKKIVDRLELIAEEKDFLSLKEGPSDKSLPRLPTTSLVNESEVCFRSNERELIVDLLLSDHRTTENGIPVIVIAGMGGIGKTTLAQFVYNDRRVRDSFDLTAWAYVSETSSDVFKVTKTIYESLIFNPCSLNNLNILQVKLESVLAGRRFLLVLDDMWNDSLIDWDLLQIPFQVAARGSKIIMTTRCQSVSSTMHSVLVCSLTPLRYQDCWSIFAKHAFGNEDLINEDSPLKSIGRRIVEKCQGLPLAVKTLGCLLHSKVEANEWDDVLNSKIWDLPSGKSHILPALRLSYYHLPSHLKKCFAYCSIFPKGHEIGKKDLVRLWIAEGLVQQQKGARTEEVAEQYFDELVLRSFLQRSGHGSCFKMHDLLNDLAQHVAGEFSFKFEDDGLPLNPERVRHLSYITNRDEAPDKFEAFSEVFNHLRTFLPLKSSATSSRVPLSPIIFNSLFPGSDDKSKSLFTKSDDRKKNLLTESDDRKKNLFPECSRLRVLSLSPYHITNLPESIGNLKHLRYLDLSYTEIESLHDRVCSLYNLETLKLSGCFQLSQLPTDTCNLTKLEYLDIKGSNVKEMPPQFGNLTKLQSLTTFVVNRNSGSRISELKKLSLLRGTLSIEGLHNVFQPADASAANLRVKKHLDELIFKWAPGTHIVHYETVVLERLRPHEYLKKLRIQHFGGSNLPDWLGDAIFFQMVTLHLVDCENCASLPPLGNLPCLKELHVEKMRGLRRLGPEFYGNNPRPFRTLEILRFLGMPYWREWLPYLDEGGFPYLQELTLHGCRQLVGNLPNHLPSLAKLHIMECRQLNFVQSNGRNRYSTLEHFHISGSCDGLQTFWLGGLARLVKLKLQDCRFLRSIEMQNEHEHLPFLQKLKIEDCPDLGNFFGRGLPSLRMLKISRCSNLFNFGDGGLPTNLHSFCFEECGNLPPREAWGLQNMASLIFYEIDGVKEQLRVMNGDEAPGRQNQSVSCTLSHHLLAFNMPGVSTSIRVLLGKLQSVLESDFPKKHKKSASYLEMLQSRLSSISAVISGAEEQQKEDNSVKYWLQKLEDVVYDADDLADEILYDDTRSKLEGESQKVLTSLPRQFIPSFGKQYGKGMKLEIKQIVKVIELLDDEKNRFNFKARKYEEFRYSDRLTTSSLVDEAQVVGRSEDRNKIVRLLLSGDAKLDGIAIVGMGGCGKTTLAKLVYNNDKVRRRFDLQAWISVSLDFDILKITRAIVEATTSPSPKSYNLDLLQSVLRDSLAGKRFLLVLDDVWNEDIIKWDALKILLKSGARGSKILITTRSRNVARVMGCSTCFELSLLSLEESWSLFQKSAYAGMGQSVPRDLADIGMEIVKKCHGLPLAVMAMGGLLRYKRTREEWHQVLDSSISLTTEAEGPIFPILRLSYDYLPDHLKHCFAFCSLFPLDYELEKEEMVLLWMAEGFLANSGGQSLEQVGAKCFDGLLERSLFIQDGLFFKMHDLVHDLVTFASGEEFYLLQGNHPIPKRTRHISFLASQYDASQKLQGIHEAKNLRTFFLINSPSDHGSCQLSPRTLEDICSRQQRLRVLSLSQYQDARLPDSIGKLKHLRYLDLSESALHSLPKSLCTLYYLETLLLTNCVKLIMLPESFVKLFNLRHLNIKGAGLKQMPKEMSRLKNLQTLTNFIVGNGLNIKELGALDLHGTLFISNLQNISFPSDASDAMLKAKRYLNELRLEWSSNESNPAKDMQTVLENLEPSKELKKLTIQYYGGTEFPSWLCDSSFSNIVFLCLRNCNNCSSLPPLGQLPSLEHLIIERIVAVSSIGHEFYRVDGSISKPYHSLKTLTFEGMRQWEQWISLQDEEFPCLQKLYLINCPKLEGGLPKSLPSLVELRISDCQMLAALLPRTPDTCKVELNNCDQVRQRSNGDNQSRTSDVEEPSQFPSSVSEISGYHQRDDFSDSIPSKKLLEDDSFSSASSVTFKVSSITKLMDLPPRLPSLKIERCNALESLPTGILDRPLLQRLYIIDCDSLKTFPQLHQPSSLKRLYIRNCRNFEFPQHIEMANQFVRLENLYLGSSCDSLVSFSLNSFPNLKTLSLWDCENLQSLSIEKGLQNDVKSLEVLEIRDCPNLTTFPKEGLQALNLTSLVLSNCNNLKSLPRWMQSLKSLQSLHINKCRELEPLPPWRLPSSLNILCISLCDKITPQTAWELHKLPSLSHFEIEGGCQEMLSFPEDSLLPTNLKSLRISSLLNLKSLDKNGLQQLTSLRILEIKDCNELRSLPEDGLPHSLHHLSITDCSSLNPKLQKRKGKEWFKIAHIPSIHVGDQVIEDADFSSTTMNLSDMPVTFNIKK